MDQDLQNIEIILRFLNDEMDKAESQAFKARLESEPELKAEVEYYRKAKQGFDTLKAEAFQENLEAWESEIEEETEAKSDNVRDINPAKGRSGRGIFPLLAMAASIVATILIFWFVIQSSSGLTTDDILASYTPEHEMPLVRNTDGSEHRLKEGIIAYTEERFGDAAQYFESIPATDPQYTDAQMYLGYAMFEDGRYRQAISAFEIVEQANSPRFSDKADWFIALSYLALDKNEEWRSNLNRIAGDDSHQYNKEAFEIIGKLE